MKTVLVTGGAGFIGSNLIAALLNKKKYRIACIDNFDSFYDPRLKQKNIASFKGNKNFVLYKKDIRDQKSLQSVFKKEKPDYVIHLAGQGNARLAVENPRFYQAVNVDGTLNLLELSKDYKVKNFLFASSSSVYGNQGKVPFSEDDRTDLQISPYGATKKAAELLAHTYHHNFGLNVICLRFFNAYGEGLRPDLVMYKWIDNILRNKEIELSGAGTRQRDYTYVGDIVEGVIKAMGKPLGYEIINLGNSKPVSLKTLLATMEKMIGKKALVKTRPSHKASVELTFADISKAKRLLKWQPKVNLEEGITRLVSWFRKNRL